MNIFESTFEKHKKLMLEKQNPEYNLIKTKMSRIMDLPFGSSFVKYLKSATNDPKVIAFLNAAKQDDSDEDDKISVSGPTHVDVKNLRATQKEVFIGKSLEYPLQKKKFDQIKNFITKGTDPELDKAPIIISGNYIIDGHHRWSQVFCWNKDAKMMAYDIQIDGSKDIEDILKKMHLGISATRSGLPLEDKPGAGNLFVMDDGTITKWLIAKIFQYDAYEAFSDPEVSEYMKRVIGKSDINEKKYKQYALKGDGEKFTNRPKKEKTSKEDADGQQQKVKYIKEVVGTYICKNVSYLKQNAGKFERKIMPQTGLDSAGNDAKIEDFVNTMKSGNVNVDVKTENKIFESTFNKFLNLYTK